MVVSFQKPFKRRQARIIHGCRSEAAETEARRGLLASEDDAGVLTAVRRGGRTRKAAPGERIGRRSRYSWMFRARVGRRRVELSRPFDQGQHLRGGHTG